jgi:preprotein translocase subunit SecF
VKLLNRYALSVCFLGAVVVVICARFQTQVEIAKAIIGALYLCVPVVVASMIVTKIHGDPLEKKKDER